MSSGFTASRIASSIFNRKFWPGHTRVGLDHTRRVWSARGEKLHFYMRNHRQSGLPRPRAGKEDVRGRGETEKVKGEKNDGVEDWLLFAAKCRRALAAPPDSGFLRLRTKPACARMRSLAQATSRLPRMEFFARVPSQLSRRERRSGDF